jgi:type II secretory pathway component PulK
VVLIVVLAVFAVTMGLAGVWARRIVFEHRHQRLVEARVQVRWLADAGLRRAAAQLAANPEYDGEEWSIADKELDRSASALVSIRVEPSDDGRGRFRLTVEAHYPEKEPCVRATKAIDFTPPSSEPAT